MPDTGLVSFVRRAEHAVFLWTIWQSLQHVRTHGFSKLADSAFKVAKRVPGVSGAVQGEVDKEIAKIEQKILGDGDPAANVALPESGLAAMDILASARTLKSAEDEDFLSGKKWGGIYHNPSTEQGDLMKLQNEVWGLYNATNSLYPNTFPSVRKFEAEIVAMCIELLHGQDLDGQTGTSAVGLLASGGTESVLIAVHGYRELARERGIADPEIVCCYTAHPALDKAAHYFGISLVKVHANAKSQQMDPDIVRGALTKRTIAIYASAPTFPHGVVDPIEELSALAIDNNIGLHVDNCLGGFYLTFLQRQGLFARKFDFELPGVTTISIDVHKYGFASKGASVIAFRTPALRRLSYVPVTDGLTLYITPTLQGARGGALMAQAWATLLHMGADGYTTSAKELYEIEQRYKRAIQETPGIGLLCDSNLAVIPMTSTDPAIDIYAVATLLEKRGWNMFTSRDPPCMAVCVGERHGELLRSWTADLQESLTELRAAPGVKVEGDAAVYGAAASLPAEVLADVMRGYVDVKMKVKSAL